MNDWWPFISALSLGVPIAVVTRMPPLLSGVFCAGLNLLFRFLNT